VLALLLSLPSFEILSGLLLLLLLSLLLLAVASAVVCFSSAVEPYVASVVLLMPVCDVDGTELDEVASPTRVVAEVPTNVTVAVSDASVAVTFPVVSTSVVTIADVVLAVVVASSVATAAVEVSVVTSAVVDRVRSDVFGTVLDDEPCVVEISPTSSSASFVSSGVFASVLDDLCTVELSPTSSSTMIVSSEVFESVLDDELCGVELSLSSSSNWLPRPPARQVAL